MGGAILLDEQGAGRWAGQKVYMDKILIRFMQTFIQSIENKEEGKGGGFQLKFLNKMKENVIREHNCCQ